MAGKDKTSEKSSKTAEGAGGRPRCAIFEDGGRQYRAEEGALVQLDLKAAGPGAELTFERVLLVSGGGKTLVGTPVVPGASVEAVVEAEEKGPKLRGLKRRNRNRSKTAFGHRQRHTLVRIRKIVAEA